jgi:Protein of unknown function (DUF3995)
MLVSFTFVALALWHFRMALAPPSRHSGAVPSVAGKALFVPTVKATVAVGIASLLCAGLVAATAGFVTIGLPAPLLSWMSYALAFGLLARAVGDFKYVGFFKRVRESRFATLDTWVYSPLCAALALGVAAVALQNGG